MSTFTTTTGDQLTVERGAPGSLIVSFFGSNAAEPDAQASVTISDRDWAALTSDIDVPRRVIVEAPRGRRFDNADAFAKARETLPGALCQTRIWWEDAAGHTVNWSDDSAVCTKWEFEEVLAA